MRPAAARRTRRASARAGLAGAGRLLGLLVLLTTTLHCRSVPPAPPVAAPERIVRSSDGAELSLPELVDSLAEAEVVYLGERHDEPRHHQAQLELLEALVAKGIRPALGFEAFELADTSALLDFAKGPAKHDEETAERRLRTRLGWGEERDPSWSYYVELLRFARRNQLEVFGADLPTALRARMGRVGLEGLSAVEATLLDSTGFEDAAYEALMREIIKQAHCGYGSDTYLSRMYQIWVARNDTMSLAIAETLARQPGAPIVMILGNGHVLFDMGVYERVAHRRAGVRQLNIGLWDGTDEAPDGLADRIAVPVDDARFEVEHQVVWYLRRERAETASPCAAFEGREQPQPAAESPDAQQPAGESP